MSIGVSGIIKLKKYSVSNAVELSYEISRGIEKFDEIIGGLYGI